MPLALLLQDTLRPLNRGTRRLAVWADVGDRLALVGLRMRTAYLVRWFGPVLPAKGNALRVSFVNLREILARAANVRSRQQPTAVDAGMAGETAMGLVGSLAGWTFSPGVQFTVSIAWVFTGAWSWWKLLGVLNILALGGISSAIFLGLSGAAPISAAVSDRVRDSVRGLAALYEGIVEVARPLQTFWGQLSGPRDQIRNPVLRAFMEAADRAAVLVPLLFGAVAYLLVRVAPALIPLSEAIVAMVQFASALTAGMLDAVDSLVTPLTELFAPATGPSLISLLTVQLIDAFGYLGQHLSLALLYGAGALGKVSDLAQNALTQGWKNIDAVARESILEHPLTKTGPIFAILGDLTGLFIALFLRTAWNVYLQSVDEQNWNLTNFRKWLGSTQVDDSPATPSSFPAFPKFHPPTMRPLEAIWTGAFDRSRTPPNPFELTPDAEKALKYRPPSVFGPAVAETARRWKDSAGIRTAALRLLPALQAVLPAAARPHLSGLAQMLGAKPEEAKPAKKAAAAPTPVKALPPTRLRPRIRNLYVEVPVAVGRERTDRWIATLRKTLDAGPLPVPAVVVAP
jgi:F0F1-type ATP synthase membrane subunit c/vacuolar-type H+-ATPase subunit K